MSYRTSLALGLLLLSIHSRSVCATITLDDFVDNVSIPLPEQQDEFATTASVGPFDAERSIYVHGGLSELVGVVDVNALHASQFTMELADVERVSVNAHPSVAPSMYYDFPNLVDLTKNGEFNAFFVDFDLNAGPVPPDLLRIVVQQDIEQERWFWWRSVPIAEERLEPFTAVFPFRAFISRDGAERAPPFSSVQHYRLNFRGGGEDAKWEIRLESIRVGTLPDGDYNGNGLVEQADLDLVLSNWGEQAVPAAWFGDQPDGPVDQGELDLVLPNWGTPVPPPDGTTASAAAVPEPSTILIVLVVCGMAVLLALNRRDTAAL